MRIRYHGHACFEFVNESGRSLLFDPYKPDALGALTASVEASPDGLRSPTMQGSLLAQPEWADTPVLDENLETPDIRVEAIPTYHDGELWNEWAFDCLADSFRHGYCPPRRYQQQLSSAALQALEKPTVLLLPVGGTYTFGPEEGLAINNLLKPTWIVPMHAADPNRPSPSLFPHFRIVEGLCDIENKAWETTLSQPGEQSTLLYIHVAFPRGTRGGFGEYQEK